MFTTLLVQPLFNILFVLYGLIPGHDFGVAVVAITILVRLLLWPLVTKQLHSQKAMQALAPEVAKVRQKAKGDKQKETQMLMELYKEKGTSPFASLLPLLIQLPIFFALYIVFRDAVHPDKIASLTYDFVEKIPQVAQVIAHHSQFSPSLFGVIDLTKPSLVLAAAAGLAQFFQTRMLQPRNQPMDDQARLMRGVTFIFPVITIVVGLTLPSALALYWTVTSLVAAYQQWLILLRDAHEMEEAEDQKESSGGQVVTTEVIDGEVLTTRISGGGSKKSARKSRKTGRKKKAT